MKVKRVSERSYSIKSLIRLKNRKNKKKILLEKFQEEKTKELNKKKINNQNKASNQQVVIKEKAIISESSIELQNEKNVITINSLKKGIGCTHATKYLASYIKDKLNKTVCIIQLEKERTDNILIDNYELTDFYKAYELYDFILIDAGMYSDNNNINEIKLSTIKIMLSILDDNYLKELATFIENEGEKGNWKYIFNHVPDNKKRKVDDLMEDYHYLFMPPNDLKNFDKTTIKAFNKLFKREKKKN